MLPPPPDGPARPENTALHENTALRVLLPLPLPPFSFLPAHGAPLPEVGCRVAVPWQGGVRIGVVVGFEPLRGGAGLELREVVGVLDARPFLTPAALEALERTAHHTCAPAGVVLANFLPVGLHDPLFHEVRALAPLEGEAFTGSWQEATELPLARLELFRKQGLVEERVRAVEAQVQRLVALKEADAALAGPARAAQRRALSLLFELGETESAAALARDAEVSPSAVRALVKKGYAGYRQVAAPSAPLPYAVPYDLSEPSGGRRDRRQSAVQNTPLPPGPVVGLSGGVREARVRQLLPTLKADLAAGGSVLVLAPEGAFIHQAAPLWAAEVPVLTLSGELQGAQRARLWEACREGEPLVLLGTYLALFAPLARLARVVVLEESSGAYKLTSGCRVFVPTAARFLAEAAGVPLVLSDALCSPEARLLCPPAARVSLPSPTPRVHAVDLNEGGGWPLGTDLKRVLRQVEARGRQAVLIAPRRGFSAALRCAECDFLAMCPNCDLPLRYHRERYTLRCHQCGHTERAPDLCPACRNPTLSPTRAAGTEWVMSETQRLLPGFLLRRFDSDKREDLSDLLTGEPGVLVATTAILRHPPLPNVSLVAVTLLDAFLNMGDFRAEEEAYRLLLNLAELAPGRRPLTLLQSFQNDHPLLRAYAEGTGEAFMAALLRRRERFLYPPFADLAKVQLSAKQAATAERAATWLAGALRTAGATDDELLGPSPAPVARIKNSYSYQLFLRTAPGALPPKLTPALEYRGPARLRIDIDPRDVTGFLD